jgi:flagellar biosynthetic protein FliR
MLDPSEPGVGEFLIFTLVLVRVSTMVLIAPVFGSSSVPLRARVVLGIALAMLIVPLELGKTVSAATPADFLVMLGAEALVGLTLGLGVMLLFAGIQVAGQIISQLSGLQLADVFNPALDASTPIFSQLLFYVALAVFVTIGGHRTVMEALLDTFVWIPLGQGTFSQSATEAMTSLLTQSVVLGVRAAAPAMIALVLSTLVLGLVSRSLPQLGVFALGFGLNTMVTFAMLGVSLGAAAWVFQDQLTDVLDTLRAALADRSLSGSA